MTEEYQSVFENLTAKDLVAQKGNSTIYNIEEDQRVEEAMILMQTHRLRALPVYRIAVTKDPKDPSKRIRYNEYSQMLTLLDILTFATLRPLFVDKEPVDYFEDPVKTEEVRNRRRLLLQQSRGSDMLSHPVKDVMDIATQHAGIKTFHSEDSLMSLIQTLTYDVHHVLVKEGDHPTGPISMLTHSDALRFLLRSNDAKIQSALNNIKCGQVASRQPGTTANQKDAGGDAPLFMEQGRSAFSCYKTMFLGKVDSLAIVTPNAPHKLVANLSASDLRQLSLTDSFADLILLPVDQFLKKLYGSIPVPLTVKPGDALKDAMDILASKRVHRVWVVDDHQSPVGVVTITDVLKNFVPPLPELESEEGDVTVAE